MAIRIDIFAYTDYRSFLKDLYASKKAANPQLSYNSIALRAGFKSRGFLSQVLQGKTKLSASMRIKFAEAFDLEDKEREFFELLVLYNQSKTGNEKRFYFEKLRNTKGFQLKTLNPAQNRFYDHWYFSAIRSLVGIRSFKAGQFAEIGRVLVPPVPATEVKRSIELLEHLGLIVRNSNGIYELTDNFITTGAIHSESLDSFKIQVLDLVKRAVDNLPSKVHGVSTLTMAISGPVYKLMQEKIAELRKELMQIADSEANADRVYQFSFSAIPLSSIPELDQK